jgi:hypothetical protein
MAEESAQAAEELKQKADQVRMNGGGCDAADTKSLMKEAARKEAEAVNLKLRAELIERDDAGDADRPIEMDVDL